MRLLPPVTAKRPSIFCLVAVLLLGVILPLLMPAQRADALSMQLIVPDRSTIRIQNIQANQDDLNDLPQGVRDALGISTTTGLNGVLMDLFEGKELVDPNIWDNEEVYRLNVGNCNGDNATTIQGVEPGQSTADVILRIPFSAPRGGNCYELRRENVSLPPTNILAAFRWVDASTIEPVQGGQVTGYFVLDSSDREHPNRFVRQNESGACIDYIDVIESGIRGRFHQLDVPDGGSRAGQTQCREMDFSNIDVEIQDRANRTIPAGDGRQEDQDAQAEPSCESEGGELSWILCPVLRTIDGLINSMEEEINNLLEFPNQYFEEPTITTLRNAWGRLRNIAYLILLPVMLVMVISTALGYEVVSAYTLKRALPRLVIATIFIATSFDLMRLVIILNNNIALSIEGLITSSIVGDSEVTLAGMFDPNFAQGALATVIGVPTAVLAGAVAIPAIVMFGLSALLSIFTALLALALRQGLLIILMLLAPLAILSWIFPGNDKLWKLWWGTFSKLLLVYPLYNIVIAAAKAFAALLDAL